MSPDYISYASRGFYPATLAAQGSAERQFSTALPLAQPFGRVLTTARYVPSTFPVKVLDVHKLPPDVLVLQDAHGEVLLIRPDDIPARKLYAAGLFAEPGEPRAKMLMRELGEMGLHYHLLYNEEIVPLVLNSLSAILQGAPAARERKRIADECEPMLRMAAKNFSELTKELRAIPNRAAQAAASCCEAFLQDYILSRHHAIRTVFADAAIRGDRHMVVMALHLWQSNDRAVYDLCEEVMQQYWLSAARRGITIRLDPSLNMCLLGERIDPRVFQEMVYDLVDGRAVSADNRRAYRAMTLGFDFRRYRLQIIDNGHGASAEQKRLIGDLVRQCGWSANVYRDAHRRNVISILLQANDILIEKCDSLASETPIASRTAVG